MFRPVNAGCGNRLFSLHAPRAARKTLPRRDRKGVVLLIFLLGSCSSPAADVKPYRQAMPGYRYSFPRDHFEHPGFRTEWWYYTGNLRDSAGKRYGFELVFFRQGQRRGSAANPSAWRVDDLYLAHVAVTDIGGKRFYYHERLNRAGPGVAGASLAQRRVWNGNWSAQWQADRQTIEATADEFRFRLDLRSAKPPVVHGLDGVSRKGEAAGEASHYVSLTRLNVSGELSLDGAKHDVTGMSWMDHEWFTNQLGKDQVGWDWFSVQLDNQTELMLFRLRRRDGSIDPYSAGTYINAQGHARHLTRNEFSLTPEGYWKSARTGANYPVRWQIRVPSLGISLDAAAALDAQELSPGNQTGPAYWEGSVTYTGSASGAGYLEMTGYDKPVRLE
jgi:predicted secreted hydrolase